MTVPESSSVAADVALFDRSDRRRMQFSGAKAAESLTGLVTNDVLALVGGDGLYACALTAKGRVIADVRILAIAGDDATLRTFLVDANASAGVGFAAMTAKYVNPRLAKYVDVSATSACLTLDGGGAATLLHSLGAESAALSEISQGPAFTHRVMRLGDVPVRLVRVPDLGSDTTFDLHVESDAVAALSGRLQTAGATLHDAAEWQRRRTLSGRPEWGIDMDEGTLAQEANMDRLHAISYRKGCYTGQETVARVHFRGHVNRTLRRVTYGDAVVPPNGAALVTAEGGIAGDARSTATSDGSPLIGIAMLRREVAQTASLSWVDADGTAHAATVVDAVESE